MEEKPDPILPEGLQRPGNSLFSGLVLFFVGFFIASIVVSSLIATIPGWLGAYNGFINGTRTDETALMVFRWSQGLVSLLWMALPGIVWAGMHGKPLAHLKLTRFPKAAILVLAVLGMIVSVPFVESLIINPHSLNLPESMKAIEQFLKDQGTGNMKAVQYLVSDTSGPGFVANLFFVALIPAFAEEIFFRGFLQQALGRLMKPAFAIVITAAAFSLLHWQFLVFVPRFILGILLGYFFFRSGKLLVSVAAHFAYNSFSVIMAFLSAKGLLTSELMTDDYRFPLWLAVISAVAMVGLVVLFYKNTGESANKKNPVSNGNISEI